MFGVSSKTHCSSGEGQCYILGLSGKGCCTLRKVSVILGAGNCSGEELVLKSWGLGSTSPHSPYSLSFCPGLCTLSFSHPFTVNFSFFRTAIIFKKSSREFRMRWALDEASFQVVFSLPLVHITFFFNAKMTLENNLLHITSCRRHSVFGDGITHSLPLCYTIVSLAASPLTIIDYIHA